MPLKRFTQYRSTTYRCVKDHAEPLPSGKYASELGLTPFEADRPALPSSCRPAPPPTLPLRCAAPNSPIARGGGDGDGTDAGAHMQLQGSGGVYQSQPGDDPRDEEPGHRGRPCGGPPQRHDAGIRTSEASGDACIQGRSEQQLGISDRASRRQLRESTAGFSASSVSFRMARRCSNVMAAWTATIHTT